MSIAISSTLRLCVLLSTLWLACPPLSADIRTASQVANVTILPWGALTVNSTLSLIRSGGPFTPYTATLPVSYRARTTPTGSGAITVQASGDFSPAGGPSIAAGTLTYTCMTDGYAAPCSGSQTVSSSSQRPVINLGGGACTGGGDGCSANDPAGAAATFLLTNDPSTPTGVYSVTLVFTLSCT
jgi:hypothetical protein